MGIIQELEKKRKQCKRCKYEWISIVQQPRLCPKCRSHLWNTPYKSNIKPENKAQKRDRE